MYKAFFGFNEKPFNVTPDSRFLFQSDKHREALAHMVYGIQERKGFITITGEVGTGKTILCRTLLSQLDKNIHTALILNPDLSKLELLQAILDDLELPSNSDSRKQLIDTLNEFLLKESARGKNVAVLIDEAQNLTPDVLEQIRLLSNLETENEKLLQIVLIGQPELNEILDLPNLRQLKQRIAVRYHITPLTLEETRAYIQHRLSVAGGSQRVEFTPSAVKRIYQHSKGVPRVINILCDQALLSAYADEERKIEKNHISEAITELSAQMTTRGKERAGFTRLRFSFVTLLNFLLSILLIILIAGFLRYSVPLFTKLIKSGTGISSTHKTSTYNDKISSFQYLASMYHISTDDIDYILSKRPGMNLWKLAQHYGFDLVIVHSNLTKLKQYNFPAILEFTSNSEMFSRYVALIKLDDNKAVVYDSKKGTQTLSRDKLDQLWYGKALILFPKRADIFSFLNSGTRGEGVWRLQHQLRKLGLNADAPDGIYGDGTRDAVSRFQEENGLKVDGLVGFETRIELFKKIYGDKIPTL